MKEAVIVSTDRTPTGKAYRGAGLSVAVDGIGAAGLSELVFV